MTGFARRGLGAGAEDRSLLEIARHAVRGHVPFRMVGLRRALTGTETVWPLGGAYPFPQSPETLRVRAGGDAADDANGLGAREIRVFGLEWPGLTAASELITLAGASASAATATTFARVNYCHVTQVGTYGGANAGNVVLRGVTSNATLGGIEAGAGVSRVAVFTVPAAWTAYLVGVAFGVDGSAAVELWERRRIDDVASPLGPARNILRRGGVSGTYREALAAYIEVPEKSDIWFTSTSTLPAEVNVELEMILVNSPAVAPE